MATDIENIDLSDSGEQTQETTTLSIEPPMQQNFDTSIEHETEKEAPKIKLPKEKAAKAEKEKRSEDEIIKHQRCLDILTRYAASKRYGDYLTKDKGYKLTADYLRKLSNDDIEELLIRVKVSMNSKGADNTISDFIMDGIGLGEKIAVGSKLNEKIMLAGLHDALKEDNMFMDSLEHISLDHADKLNFDPAYRLMISLAKTIALVHSKNAAANICVEPTKKKPTGFKKAVGVSADSTPTEEPKIIVPETAPQTSAKGGMIVKDGEITFT